MSDNKNASLEIFKDMFQEVDAMTAKKEELMRKIKQFLVHHMEDSNFPELMTVAMTHALKYAKDNGAIDDIKKKLLNEF